MDGEAKLNLFYDHIEANADQSTILLATNSLTGRLWDGSLHVYSSFSDVGRPNSEKLKLYFDSNITGLKFIDKSMVLLTTACGSVQIWSTQCEIRDENSYNLYQVARKTEHFGLVRNFR